MSGLGETYNFGQSVAGQAWPTFWLALISIGVVWVLMNMVLSTSYQRGFGEVQFKKGFVIAGVVIFVLCVIFPYGWEYLLHPVVDSGDFDSQTTDSPAKALFLGDLIGSVIGSIAAFVACVWYQKTH
ncbi:hypothetical protein OH720_18490 [Pseudomonas sp. WJP1]|uniref:hypothetical protein n=1 Tax=Pseudomonas sp. WJP1 TaxID=2986947 RepID=UPI00234A8CAA|nr:hypothetical protein [Pseudomonas sp. WJP1]WCM48999.1 hypothetical protein OH720_18490 [Pseudomonas sp. WJP1]